MRPLPLRLYGPAFTLLVLWCLSGGCEEEETTRPEDDTADMAAYGFTLSGTALNLMNPATVSTEGLCVLAVEPPECLCPDCYPMESILASGTVGAGGTYELKNIVTNSTMGLFLVVRDCAEEGTVMPTVTGMSLETYQDLGDGDAITDFPIHSLDVPTVTAFQAMLAAAGYTGDLAVDGALMGWVVDGAGSPIEGAVVTGAGTTYYLTRKGLTTEGGTSAEGACFLIPGAPIYSYACTAKGYTFGNVTAGSFPGYAVIVKFVAQ